MREVQEEFMAGKLDVMVATTAVWYGDRQDLILREISGLRRILIVENR
jgi:hypothetical protein